MLIKCWATLVEWANSNIRMALRLPDMPTQPNSTHLIIEAPHCNGNTSDNTASIICQSSWWAELLWLIWRWLTVVICSLSSLSMVAYEVTIDERKNTICLHFIDHVYRDIVKLRLQIHHRQGRILSQENHLIRPTKHKKGSVSVNRCLNFSGISTA